MAGGYDQLRVLQAGFLLGGSAGPEFQFVKVTLSAAELLALPAIAPILPSPGPGKVNQIIFMTLVYRFGTTPYAAGNIDNELFITPENGVDEITEPIPVLGFLDQTQDMIQTTFGFSDSPFPLADWVDSENGATIQGTTPGLSGGDGELDLYITFGVITL